MLAVIKSSLGTAAKYMPSFASMGGPSTDMEDQLEAELDGVARAILDFAEWSNGSPPVGSYRVHFTLI